jgi:hypothetical protein
MTTFKRTFCQLSVGLALVSTVALWAGTQDVAPAVIGLPPMHLGPIGLASGETFRVNVTGIGDPHIFGPGTPVLQDCRGEVLFKGAAGNVLARHGYFVPAGTSGFVDLRNPTDVTDETAPGGRVAVKAIIINYRPEIGDLPRPKCAMSFEIFDAMTGRSSLFIGSPVSIEDPNEVPR